MLIRSSADVFVNWLYPHLLLATDHDISSIYVFLRFVFQCDFRYVFPYTLCYVPWCAFWYVPRYDFQYVSHNVFWYSFGMPFGMFSGMPFDIPYGMSLGMSFGMSLGIPFCILLECLLVCLPLCLRYVSRTSVWVSVSLSVCLAAWALVSLSLTVFGRFNAIIQLLMRASAYLPAYLCLCLFLSNKSVFLSLASSSFTSLWTHSRVCKCVFHYCLCSVIDI